jgi:hypothetical protein
MRFTLLLLKHKHRLNTPFATVFGGFRAANRELAA